MRLYDPPATAQKNSGKKDDNISAEVGHVVVTQKMQELDVNPKSPATPSSESSSAPATPTETIPLEETSKSVPLKQSEEETLIHPSHHGERRFRPKEGSEQGEEVQEDQEQAQLDGIHIPKEATTNARAGNTSLRRRRRADSEVSIDSLVKTSHSSSSLLYPATPKLRESFTSNPIERVDAKLLVKILGYLSFKELFRIRRVCKLWFNTIMKSRELTGFLDLSLINKDVEDLAICAIGKVFGENLKYISLRNCWNITDSGFQKFVELAPNLEVVDLNSCWELTDRSVSDLGICKSIKRLDLSNCRKVSDVTITNILKSSQELEELKVSYCKNLTNTTMNNITKFARTINTMFLQRCTSITDGGFQLLRNPETTLPNLTVLSLSDCSFLTDEAILSISMGCPGLRVLNLSFCCALSHSSLEYLANGCKMLLSLDLSFCGNAVYDDGLEVIASGLLEIERLSFRSCVMVTQDGLETIVQNCKNLKFLNPSSCKNLNKQILEQVSSSHPNIKLLNGNVQLHEVATSPHFRKSSADAKFSFN